MYNQQWGINRQLSMEGIFVQYFSCSIHPGYNKEKYEVHSYIRGENEQDARDPHSHMFHLLNTFLNQEY